jgi:hypothetical protein
MLWFIQVSVTSLIIIFVLHNLYSFFKETLTVPKIKDMVKRPQQKYETLFRELRSINAINANANANANATSTSSAMSSANTSDSEMKNELKRYLMDLNMSQQPQPQQMMHQTDFMESGSMFKINSNVISNNEFPTQLNSSVFA